MAIRYGPQRGSGGDVTIRAGAGGTSNGNITIGSPSTLGIILGSPLNVSSNSISNGGGGPIYLSSPLHFYSNYVGYTSGGSIQYNGDNLLAFNPTAGATSANQAGSGLLQAPQMVFSQANNPTSSANTTQNVFAAANDVLTSLEYSKLYRFKAKYYCSFTYNGTAGAINIGFAFSNAPTTFKYSFKTYPQSPGTVVTYQGYYATNAASTVVPSGTGGAWVIEVDGYFVTNATLASTFTPQFICTAASNAGAYMQAGSYIEIQKLGVGTATNIAGNWA